MLGKIYNFIGKYILIGKHVEFMVILYFFFFLRGKISGVENLPEKGGFILASNHESYLDWLILYSLFNTIYKKRVSFLGKAKLFHHPLFRFYLAYSRTIKIDYNDTEEKEKTYKIIISKLENGDNIGIFPEGTRSRDGSLQKTYTGVAQMALDANVPVIPTGLVGFYETWPSHQAFPGFSKCTVKIDKPLMFSPDESMPRKDQERQITDDIMVKISKLTGEKYERSSIF